MSPLDLDSNSLHVKLRSQTFSVGNIYPLALNKLISLHFFQNGASVLIFQLTHL
jgi:hypothetical protein